MLPSQTLNLLSIFSICLLVEVVKAATNKDLIEQRQKNGFQECLSGWLDRINEHCVYPGQNTPCLLDQKEDSSKNTTPTEEFADNCCKGRCELRDFEKLCCRDKSCLNKCYKKLRTHKLRNTASLEKRSKFMFKTGILSSSKFR